MSTPNSSLSRRVIELACRAPSVHNTQPWRWRVVGDARIELHADRRRQLPTSDPSGRNLALSCGAALHHVIVAAEAVGLAAEIELVPSPTDEDLLARIQLSPGEATPEAVEALIALEQRCTDRRRFTSWPIPEARLAHLAQAASGSGAYAIPITDVTARFRTEALLGRAMTVQASDPRYADEQHEWTNHSQVDGIPISDAVPSSTGRRLARPNRFAVESEPDSTDGSVESSDGVIAICSAIDSQESWLQAGHALSAMWLRATHEGLSIVPLSQVIEVDETRHALHHDVFAGMARPQILARVGWLEMTRTLLERTPRRPLEQVIGR